MRKNKIQIERCLTISIAITIGDQAYILYIITLTHSDMTSIVIVWNEQNKNVIDYHNQLWKSGMLIRKCWKIL